MTQIREHVLTTDRMILRRFTMDDVDLLLDLDADPDVMRYLSRNSPTREDVETVILPSIIEQYRRGPVAGTFAAHDRRSGEFIGWFALDGDPHAPELGYRLRRVYWGRGLATEGARAMIELAFSAGDAAKIWAQTMYVNAGSRRVLEKCGLRHIRTFHEHFDDPLPGTEHGEVEYAITRQEWMIARQ